MWTSNLSLIAKNRKYGVDLNGPRISQIPNKNSSDRLFNLSQFSFDFYGAINFSVTAFAFPSNTDGTRRASLGKKEREPQRGQSSV